MKWAFLLNAWGWPPRIEQKHQLAIGLLEAKGDNKPLGTNWNQKFFKRHTEVKPVFASPLDKERANAQNPQLLKEWFELFARLKEKHQVV